MAVKKIVYSMPRGDSRSFPIAIPITTYSAGASIFFALKTTADNVLDDASAVLKKTLTDVNITSTDSVNKNYLLNLTPTDTTGITPATYRAELEFVSADKTIVISYPDPNVTLWEFQITGDINRRTT